MHAPSLSRDGATVKKKTPEPRLPAQPQDPAEYATAVCHTCHGRFPVKDIRGAYLERRCPLCDCLLTEEAYDAEARHVLQALAAEKSAYTDVNARINKLKHEVQTHSRWWHLPYRAWKRHQLRQLELQAKREQGLLKALEHQMNETRYGRYYTGEWFLNTHIPLTEEKGTPQEHYRLFPLYDEAGMFTLERPNASLAGKGIIAEFNVFEALRKIVLKPDSPLFHARLLPNLYLPNRTDNHQVSRLWNQLDLVLATQSCAFVIEVKRRSADIVANAPFEAIYTSKPSASSAKVQLQTFNAPLIQNSNHAVYFNDECPVYPFDNVFEVLIFEGPHKFSSNGFHFVDNVFVGCIPQQADKLVNALETACRACDKLMSQDQLDDLGEQLLKRYGDLNQQRHSLHVNRIKTIQELHAHPLKRAYA